jgi:hypothetical protein
MRAWAYQDQDCRRIHTGLSSMKLLELEMTGRNLIAN